MTYASTSAWHSDPLAHGGAGEAKDRDVEAEVAKRTEQAPVRADQLAFCVPDALDDRTQRAAPSLAVPAGAWDRESRSAPREPESRRDPGQQHLVGAATDSCCEQQPAPHQRKDVGATREEEKPTGLLEDLPNRHAAPRQEHGPGGKRADAAAG
jgi:hypothetical protein